MISLIQNSTNKLNCDKENQMCGLQEPGIRWQRNGLQFRGISEVGGGVAMEVFYILFLMLVIQFYYFTK